MDRNDLRTIAVSMVRRLASLRSYSSALEKARNCRCSIYCGRRQYQRRMAMVMIPVSVLVLVMAAMWRRFRFTKICIEAVTGFAEENLGQDPSCTHRKK